MQSVKILDNGDVVDVKTGTVIGRRSDDGTVRYSKPPASQNTTDNKPPTTQGTSDNKSQVIQDTSVEPDNQPSKKISYTKYDVRPDSEFTVKFCVGEREGRILVFDENAYLKDSNLEQHWVVFRMWTFKEQLEWKEKCTTLDLKTRMFTTNQEKYNDLKLSNLIKSWSFEEIDTKYKLFHTHGYLTDESKEVLEGMFPAIVNSIIYLMNQVLEGNA